MMPIFRPTPLIADEKHKKFKHQQNNNSYKYELEMAMSRTELPKTGTAVSSQKYIVKFLLLYSYTILLSSLSLASTTTY